MRNAAGTASVRPVSRSLDPNVDSFLLELDGEYADHLVGMCSAIELAEMTLLAGIARSCEANQLQRRESRNGVIASVSGS